MFLNNTVNKVKELLNSKNAIPALMVGTLLTVSSSSVLLRNQRYIITDGLTTTSIVSFCKEIGNVLKRANININENDQVLINKIDAITTNVNIKRAIPITVAVDGAEKNISLPIGSTVEDALNKLQITLGEEDAISVPKGEIITKDTKITIDRIEYKTSDFTEDIPFNIEKKETDSLLKGKTKIEKAGVVGKKEITVKEKFINGVPNSSERSENIIAEPQSQIELIGTKVVNNKKVKETKNNNSGPSPIASNGVTGTFVDASGKTVAYKAKHTGVCTAYCDGVRGAMGTVVKAGEDIAVNPKVIPLGSKVYIPGYGYAKATDTGGAMLRRKNPVLADLRMRNEAECRRHGRRIMDVYVLA